MKTSIRMKMRLVFSLMLWHSVAFADECTMVPITPSIVPSNLVYEIGTAPTFALQGCQGSRPGFSVYYVWQLRDSTGQLIEDLRPGEAGASYTGRSASTKTFFSVSGGAVECIPEDLYVPHCYALGGQTLSYKFDRTPTAVISRVSGACQVGGSLDLSSAQSIDPDPPGDGGGVLFSDWTIISGGTNLVSPNPGVFRVGVTATSVTVRLTVSNENGASNATTQIYSCAAPTTISVSASSALVEVNHPVSFTANISGPFSNQTWILQSRPQGSNAQLTVSRSTATLNPDKEGSYIVVGQVLDSNGFAKSASASIQATGVPTNLEVQIWQVVKNPELLPPYDLDDFVDLVADKNADVVVLVDPGADVALSKIDWCSKSYSPTALVADGAGKVRFQISPVPSTTSCTSGPTDMFIRIRDSQGALKAEMSRKVQARNTMPLSVGFVGLYADQPNPSQPTPAEINKMAGDGLNLLEALYPVPTSKLFVHTGMTLVKGTDLPGEFSTTLDREMLEKLNKDKELEMFSLSNLTHVVGVATQGYFDFHQIGRAGEAEMEIKGVQVKVGSVASVPHELAHTYCLRYDVSAPGVFRTDCTREITNLADYGHTTQTGISYEAFLNYDVEVDGVSFNRGFQQGLRRSLMTAANPGQNLNEFWMSEFDYAGLFGRNLVKSSREGLDAPRRILISGTINPTGNFERFSTYVMRDSARAVEETVGGEYLVELKDINRNVLYSGRFNSTGEVHRSSSVEHLQFSVPDKVEGVFVDIYKDRKGKMRQGVGTVVLLADLIGENLKYVPNSAIVGEPLEARGRIAAALAAYRASILEKQLGAARQILLEEISPTLHVNLKDEFATSSALDVGKSELLLASFGSLARLEAMAPLATENPVNPFLRLDFQGEPTHLGRVNLRVSVIHPPADKEFLVVNDVSFDGIRVYSSAGESSFDVESFKLELGNHVWRVDPKLVSKKNWQTFGAALDKLRREAQDLKLQLEDEKDPDKRAIIEQKLAINLRKINGLKASIEESKRPLGQPAEVRFVVQ